MVILPLSRAAAGTGPRSGEIHYVFAHTPAPIACQNPAARMRPPHTVGSA